MAKPPPRRIPADDCEVTIAGVTYRPHEGEWVEVVGSTDIGELLAFWDLVDLATSSDEDETPEDVTRRRTMQMKQGFRDLCESLAECVVDWNLTNLQGRPLPKPDGTIGPIKKLRDEELYWLRRAIRGETPDARKNGSNGSVAHSETAPRSRGKRS